MKCWKCHSYLGFYAATIDSGICRECLWKTASDRVRTEMRTAEHYEAYQHVMRVVLSRAPMSLN